MSVMPLVIAVCSTKGGVGKSTIAIFLSLALKALGHRTLLVDTDGSLDSTDVLLRDVPMDEIEARGVFNYLSRVQGFKELTSCILQSPLGLDIVPSHPDMEDLGPRLMNDGTSYSRFSAALRRLDYEYIVIDCPGDLSINTGLGLFASDLVVTPCSDGRWEARGVLRILGKLEEMYELTSRSIVHRAVISNVTSVTAEAVRPQLPFPVTRTSIFKNPAYKTATGSARGLRVGTSADSRFLELATELKEALRG